MSAAAPAPPRRLCRDPDHAIVAGVLAGFARRIDIDPIILRVAFVVVVVASGGLALIAYGVAWATMPGPGGRAALRLGGTTVASERGWRLAAGAGLLMLAALLVFRQLGIWWSDALVWPLVLAAGGAALLWRQSRPPAPSEPEPVPPERSPGRSPVGELYRGGFAVALALILAPFLWRLGRSLALERAERIRSQERAELAAHLHDSVLQTLTLMQKRADDPREVAALARRQERELRDWLAADGRSAEATSFASALRSAAEAVEDDHRVAIEVVTVGDCELDARAEAVLGAAREALTNAAKHAAEPGPIRVYAEVKPGSIEVFVRDRGPGFDLAAVPADRRGVRESIVGRMERAGGSAELRRISGGGTEVALRIARTATTREDDPR